MAFNYTVSLYDPAAALDGAQDAYLMQALDNALNVWGQYLGGSVLKVQLNVRNLGPANSSGLIALADAAPTTLTSDANGLRQPAAVAALRSGTHVAGSDITISFNSQLLAGLATNTSYNPVTLFEHELMHGFGFDGFENPYYPSSVATGETPFDSLSSRNGPSDVFTGAAAEYVYGGPVPLTTGLGPGSNYYHVGATGTAADPAALRADLIYPISEPGQSITTLDVAMLEDIGIPLSAAGYALIDPSPSTTIGSLATVKGATVTDPVIGGTTQPGEQVTVLSGSTVLGTTNADGSGNWAFRAMGLADGPVTLTALLPGAGGPVVVSTSLTLDTLGPLSRTYLDVVGRPVDAAALPGLRAYLLGGGSVAALRNYLATTAEAATALGNVWTSVVGRAILARELPVDEQALANGASLASLRGVLATSAEAAAKLAAVFNDTVGRAPLAAELPLDEAALAGTASLASLRMVLGASTEEATAVTALFTSALGRAPLASELPQVQQQIGAGAILGNLRTVLATSKEEAGAVTAAYQSVLGRTPSAAEIQAVEAGIAGGTSLAAAKAAMVNSVEAGDDVTAAFQSALGRPANPVEVAAGRSELQSGISLALVRTQVAQLAGGPAPQPPGVATIAITPATLAGAGPNLVYGLPNNDALIAGAAETVTDQFDGASGEAIISGFNPVVDVFQIQAKQATSFAQLALTQPNAADTLVSVPGGAAFLLHGTPPAALTAANFHFV